MKRLLISAASLVVALSVTPAYGSSHGHDEAMEGEKEGAGMGMEEQKDHGMEGGTHDATNLEELPPTSAGQPAEEGMDDKMHDDSGMKDKMETLNMEEKKSSSEY